MNEQQCLIKEPPKDNQDNNSEEEWSEDESSSNSEYSDSDRYSLHTDNSIINTFIVHLLVQYRNGNLL